jgi:hypothetical protein
VFTHARVDIALEDPARYALMFQRPIAGYEPSPEAYGLAIEAFAPGVELLGLAGVTDPGDAHGCAAMVSGLMDSQLANEPSGDRYLRYLDRLINMYLDEIPSRRHQ